MTDALHPQIAAEFARKGLRFYGGAQASATGRAPSATIPTTGATAILWNGNAEHSLIIERITMWQLSGTAAVGANILAAITNAAVASPTAAANFASTSASKGGRATKCVWGENITLGATPTWGVWQGSGNPATTTNGGITADISGLILIPPGYALALNVLSGTGTSPLFLPTVVWSEAELDLE